MAERKNFIGLQISQLYHGHEAELCKAWNQKDNILLTWSSSYFRAKIVFAQKKSEELVTIISVKIELDGRCKKMCTKGVSARFIALISGKNIYNVLSFPARNLYISKMLILAERRYDTQLSAKEKFWKKIT